MDEADLFGTLEDSPNINVVMKLQEAIVNNPSGFATYFNATTDGNGFYSAINAVVPANWLFTENNGPCANESTVATVGNAATQDLDCIALVLGYNVNPAALYTKQPTSRLQIAGTGMSTKYGMPHVQIWSSTGTKIAEVVATSLVNNVLTSPAPSLSGVQTGTYGLEVLNVQSDGSLSPAGAAALPIVPGGITYSTQSSACTYLPPSPYQGPPITAYTQYYYNGWAFMDANQVQHLFKVQTESWNGGTESPDCQYPVNSASASGTATDGSGYKISITNYIDATVTSPSGVQVKNY